jgi:pilus assembly protein CpaE
MALTILIVDDSEVVIKLAQLQLSEAGYNILAARDGASGLKMAKDTKPDLVILDVEMPEMNGYEVCRQMRQLHATKHIPIVMLTSLSDIANMQAGYDAGADDYITKPFKPIELQMRVTSILRQTERVSEASSPPPENQIVAVFSLRGGAGCSSLATNFAVGLRQMWNKKTVLLDLSLPAGTCDVMFDVHPTHSLSTLIGHEINTFDEDLIEGHLTSHSTGTELLAGILNPADADLITENIVSLILDHLRNIAHYIVIDTSHNFSPATLAALDAADRIIIPITPDIISARLTLNALKVFDMLSYPRDKIEVIVNWIFPKDGLDKGRIEKFIGHPVMTVIPYTPEAWSKGINLGTPVIMDDPSAPLVTMLENLVWHFSTEEDRSRKEEKRTEMWLRVAKRRWKQRANDSTQKKGVK